jgi:phosphoglycolate phosphatase
MNMKPRRFDLIAFDWDGTLFDSTAIITRCIQEAVVDVGGARPSDAQAAYVIGMALGPALAHAAPDVSPEKYPELGARYRHHYLRHQGDLTLFDGVLPMLAALKDHQHKLAVATGKSRRGLNEVLHSVQLQGVFDDSRTADETAGKPDPTMLFELMQAQGVAAERTLMIGDTTHDLAMACNAGCPCVGVSYGAHDDAQFATYAPLFVAHSVASLHQWLAEHA